MGTLSTFFTFNKAVSTDSGSTELPEIFPLEFKKADFIRIDTICIYSKILTDVIERTHGLTDDMISLLWDNCLKSSSNDGLITMLSKAMAFKKDLFLVYEKAIGVVREAKAEEIQKIRADYETKAQSDVGIYISFKNYDRADMVKLYSGLEYSTISSLYKNMNAAKALQVKISDLRSSVGLNDSEVAIAQAKGIAKAMSDGRDLLMDAKDSIETAAPNLDPTKHSIAFIDSKRSFYLGLPAAYINGEQTGGLGDSGEADTKAIERGLKSYYFSIVKPVLEELFGVKLIYKSQDFRQISQALEAMKTFELVSEEYLSSENKKKVIESLLDIDAADNKTTEAPTVTLPSPAGFDPNANTGRIRTAVTP